MSKLSLKFLPADIRTIIINYVPEIYIYKCRKMNKRLRTEINKLDIEINAKKRKITEYKKSMNYWCPHDRVHSTRWWDGHRGHTCYECVVCGGNLNGVYWRKNRSAKIVSHSYE